MIAIINTLSLLSLSLVLGGLTFQWLAVRRRHLVKQFVGTTGESGRKKPAQEIAAFLVQAARQCVPLGNRFTFGSDEEQAARLLSLAGSPMGLTPAEFRGLKAALALAGMLGGSGLSLIGMTPFLTIVLALIGFFGPELWLRKAATHRQMSIGAALPDFLDMMSVCLQAGMPQDPALRLVAERFPGPLSQELIHFCQEVEIGVPRIEAYKNILARNTCKELEGLVQALIQGAQLGVPIATTFAIQARDMRSLRGHRAKELAGKASPKITLVTTFLVTPAVFFFIIGLLVLNLIFNPDAFGIGGLF